jgi:hypothetical protein
MNTLHRRLTATVLAGLIGFSATAQAATEVLEDELVGRPTMSSAVLDTAIARPLMAAGTLGGIGVFLVSLPFSILGGNVKESADTLILRPADATFRRCLGCTVHQDEMKNQNTLVDETPQLTAP